MSDSDDLPIVEEIDPKDVESGKLQLEEGNENADASNMDEAGGKTSRGDKKTRKLVQKLGLTPIPDTVRRVVMKQSDRLIAFDQPDVYHLGNTYVVFGDAKVEDLNQAMKEAHSASQFRSAPPNPQSTGTDETDANKETEGEDENNEEYPAKDIEMCMSQANCSREKAIETLKKNNGDVVNSIMELSV